MKPFDVTVWKNELRTERTAKQLAGRWGCSIPTVYRRIQALKESGAEITESKNPGKTTGPVPVRYRLVRR